MGINCSKCSDGVKAINGCETDSTMGERWEIGPYKSSRCPIKEITSDGLEYMTAYRFYKQGQFPCVGGWMDQSKALLDAIQTIDEQVALIERQVQKQTTQGR